MIADVSQACRHLIFIVLENDEAYSNVSYIFKIDNGIVKFHSVRTRLGAADFFTSGYINLAAQFHHVIVYCVNLYKLMSFQTVIHS